MSTKSIKKVIAHALAVVMLLGCMTTGLGATFGAGPLKASAEDTLSDTDPVPVWYKLEGGTLHLSGVGIDGYDQTTDAGREWEVYSYDVTQIEIDNEISPTTTEEWFAYFYWVSSINGMDNLKTSEVKNMKYMFHDCSSLRSVDVSGFDTSKIEDFNGMFRGCQSLTTIYAKPDTDWYSVRSVSSELFDGCSSLTGSMETTYSSQHKDKEYARVDGGSSAPGYFTAKGPAPTPEPDPDPTPEPYPTPTPAPFTPSVAPGATAEEAEAAILAMTSDADPAGSMYAPLKAKSTKQTKKSVTLKWSGVGGAVRYVVYGNRCNNGAMQKLSETAGTSVKLGSIAGANVNKGTYYKFIVVAIDAGNRVVSTSKVVHAASAGGKVGNYKKVTVKKAVTKKAKKLKAGKSLKLKAKAVKKKLKVKKHTKAVRYESSNPAVAAVTDSGKVYAVAKGSCVVYAYTQNGVSKAVKITVK